MTKAVRAVLMRYARGPAHKYESCMQRLTRAADCEATSWAVEGHLPHLSSVTYLSYQSFLYTSYAWTLGGGGGGLVWRRGGKGTTGLRGVAGGGLWQSTSVQAGPKGDYSITHSISHFGFLLTQALFLLHKGIAQQQRHHGVYSESDHV